MTSTAMNALLRELLGRRITGEGWNWLEEVRSTFVAGLDQGRLLGAYTAAPRHLGKRAVVLEGAEQAALGALDPELSLSRWTVEDLGRAILLLTVFEGVPDIEESARLALAAYEHGDSREQQSWLRALSLLPSNARFVETAIDACRTSILPLFESVACENPYPARRFPDLNFNQVVLKALFNGVALARIVGLDRRLNGELSRMADDYVSEREAAGRPVPVDIWVVLAPHIAPDRLERVYRYLRHADPSHRSWAAVGLGHVKIPAIRMTLERQRAAERDPMVVEAIDGALARMERGPHKEHVR